MPRLISDCGFRTDFKTPEKPRTGTVIRTKMTNKKTNLSWHWEENTCSSEQGNDTAVLNICSNYLKHKAKNSGPKDNHFYNSFIQVCVL